MQNTPSADLSPTPEGVREGGVDLSHLVLSQARTISTQGQQIESLKHQLAWFQRQVFGQKSERFAPEPDPTQMHLGEVFSVPDVVPETRKSVPAHRVVALRNAGSHWDFKRMMVLKRGGGWRWRLFRHAMCQISGDTRITNSADLPPIPG